MLSEYAYLQTKNIDKSLITKTGMHDKAVINIRYNGVGSNWVTKEYSLLKHLPMITKDIYFDFINKKNSFK